MPPLPPPTVPVALYDRGYYESVCGGFAEARLGAAGPLPRRLQRLVELAQPLGGIRLLDVGAGRGEVVRAARAAGARAIGIDLSPTVVALAHEGDWPLVRGDARRLPFPDRTFDRVTLADLVEHLAPPELAAALAEVRRVLAPDGRVIVHTMPNSDYYRFGYPLVRAALRLTGRRVPVDPRDRWPLLREMHVGEMSPRALRRAVAAAGLSAEVWLESTVDHDAEESDRRLSAIRKGLVRTPILRRIFVNEIFAVGRAA